MLYLVNAWHWDAYIFSGFEDATLIFPRFWRFIRSTYILRDSRRLCQTQRSSYDILRDFAKLCRALRDPGRFQVVLEPRDSWRPWGPRQISETLGDSKTSRTRTILRRPWRFEVDWRLQEALGPGDSRRLLPRGSPADLHKGLPTQALETPRCPGETFKGPQKGPEKV